MVPQLSGLNCPKCGAAIEMRTFGRAVSITCQNCLSILDATDPNLKILQQAWAREKIPPLIPLGTRGTLSGVLWEVIGFQVRTVMDGDWSWQEYLLFNPYHGYRYLTEYNGHWNFVRSVQALPEPAWGNRVRFEGNMYKLFSRCTAATSYVIGEFPWQVRVGETVEATDFVAVPRLLSSESTQNETVWSLGEYITGAEIWQAFKLQGYPPPTYGVFENQPSPYRPTGGLWKIAFEFLAAALFLSMLLGVIASDKQIYATAYSLTMPTAVTAPFEVSGRPSNVEIHAHNRSDSSFYLRYALVNQATGQATEFGREVERNNTVTVPDVPRGRYYLRLEADHVPVQFDLQVKSGVPTFSFLGIALMLLLVPPVMQTWRTFSFERQRWMESSTS